MRPSNRGLILTVGLVVAWMLIGWLLVPPVIGSAYSGDTFALFNSVLRGAHKNPVEFYMQKWAVVTVVVGLGIAAVGTALSLPVVRRQFSRQEAWQPEGMSRLRLLVINTLVLSIIGIGLVEIGLGRDDYPFSSYRMYSQPRTEYKQLEARIFGIDADGQEIHLAAPEHLDPFQQGRIRAGFKRLAVRKNAEKRMRTALKFLLDRYESRRAEGKHDGPALVGIRIYRLEWGLLPDASNRDSPEHRELLAEYPP